MKLLWACLSTDVSSDTDTLCQLCTCKVPAHLDADLLPYFSSFVPHVCFAPFMYVAFENMKYTKRHHCTPEASSQTAWAECQYAYAPW